MFMSKTVVEYVSGELVRDGKAHSVKLKLMVVELTVDESAAPVARSIARTELIPTSGLADGPYALRFVFDGKPEEHSTRVQGGMLLSG
jgi:hypothetical protein